MKNFLNKTRQNRSFRWIKKNLDPAKTYLVFEKQMSQNGAPVVRVDSPLSRYLEAEGVAWQELFDPKVSRDYLVIRLDRKGENEALAGLMGHSELFDATYYIFKAEQEDRKND
ncbi:MAG: hypothetical protein R6V41_06145 [Desulfobacteraceae bacterium]